MAQKYTLDDIDKKILAYLMKNARMPFLEIARECGISGAAIHQRVKKLEEADVIKGSHFTVKPKALGYEMCAFMGVFLERANVYSQVIESLQSIPEVVECHFITGSFTLLLKIYCRDICRGIKFLQTRNSHTFPKFRDGFYFHDRLT